MMTSSKSKHSQPEPATRKKIKTNYLGSEDAADNSDDFLGGPEINVGVDELCLIFGNYCPSVGDLLSFRMVNKNWRDAATSTLLKRDALCVNLNVDKDEDFSTSEQPGSRKLSQLTELVSNSPKFPTTKFNLHNSTNAYVEYNNIPDLLLFFKLHGAKIRTLCTHGWITRKILLDILINYTPSLVCLNLSKGKLGSSKEDGNDESSSGLRCKSEALPITSLWLGDYWKGNYYPGSSLNDPESDESSRDATERNIVHWLLSSSSKLKCIENVSLDSLEGVIREGKGQLVQSFYYFISDAFSAFSSQMMTRFLALSPNLSAVTLDMEYEETDKGWEPKADITLVNAFIKSFKDTVQDFKFLFKCEAHDWNSKVQIPPMNKLRSIAIIGNAMNTSMELRGLLDVHENFIQFEDGISAQNYFPSLKKISVFVRNKSGDIEEANVMSFFKFKSARVDGSVWDSLPDVDTLETDWDVVGSLYEWEDTPQELLLPEMFPNIRNLKIRCVDMFLIEKLWWIICPEVEFMEIYGIEIESMMKDVEDEEYKMSHFVDKLFTGFSLEMCHKLGTTQLPDKHNNLDMVEFLQDAPSIRKLRHLKEFKLQFEVFEAPFSTEFASAVTGVNAFSKMPDTKFIVSYDLDLLRKTTEWRKGMELDEALAAEELCFGPIKPYVQIVHEKCTLY